MSKSYPYSGPGDNAGRCESCNLPDTVYQMQMTYPVRLPAPSGGGTVMGTMYLCPKCLKEHQERDAGKKP